MSKTRKNYILFTFSKYYNEVNHSWKPSYHTRESLVHRIAITELYHNDESKILSNLVDDMDEASKERNRYVWIKTKCAYNTGYFMEVHRYYIAKIVGDNLVRVKADDLRDLINKEVEVIIERKEKEQRKYRAEDRCKTYTFRRGPVPGVHKSRWHRGCYYRHPLTIKTKRNEYYVDDEYTFKDNKIKQLPTVYDDLCRHIDKSWKTSCKVRKQWMKHVDKHIETLTGFDKRSMTDWNCE